MSMLKKRWNISDQRQPKWWTVAVTELTVTFKQKTPQIASTHRQTWVKTDWTTRKIDDNLHRVPFPRATSCGLLECSPRVFSHFCPTEQHRSCKSYLNPNRTHCQTELTHIAGHCFSTQLQCKKQTNKTKQQTSHKIIKWNERMNKRRDGIQREIKVQQVLLRRRI